MTGRVAKIIMCLCLGLYAGLTAFDNIVDYGANFAFVQHVLSMDTTFPESVVRSRAVDAPGVWRIAYGSIIAGEAATALLFLAASRALWRTRRDTARFAAAKRWVAVAATTGFLVWFLGFAVIGGEWFAMWQSPRWNGQEPAFRFYMTLLAVLLFVNQPDPEICEPSR